MAVSNAEFFDRRATVKVIEQDIQRVSNGPGLAVTNVANTEENFASQNVDGTPGFRIRFNVLKNIEGTPNPSTIEIYNLGEKSRNIVQKVNSRIILEAGYGDQTEVIFRGNIRRSRTEKVGPDYITKIEAADGLVAYEGAVVNQSFGQPTSLTDVVKTLTDSLKQTNLNVPQITGIPAKQYQSGIVLSGKTVNILDKILRSEGVQFTIQDETVLFLEQGSVLSGQFFVLSVDTGLVGIPKVGDSSLSLTSLMNPQLKPFSQVLVRSKFVNGLYRMIRVEHKGDTFEGQFITQLECDRAEADAPIG